LEFVIYMILLHDNLYCKIFKEFDPLDVLQLAWNFVYFIFHL